jgi:hypothetical protein
MFLKLLLIEQHIESYPGSRKVSERFGNVSAKHVFCIVNKHQVGKGWKGFPIFANSLDILDTSGASQVSTMKGNAKINNSVRILLLPFYRCYGILLYIRQFF